MVAEDQNKRMIVLNISYFLRVFYLATFSVTFDSFYFKRNLSFIFKWIELKLHLNLDLGRNSFVPTTILFLKAVFLTAVDLIYTTWLNTVLYL